MCLSQGHLMPPPVRGGRRGHPDERLGNGELRPVLHGDTVANADCVSQGTWKSLKAQPALPPARSISRVSERLSAPSSSRGSHFGAYAHSGHGSVPTCKAQAVDRTGRSARCHARRLLKSLRITACHIGNPERKRRFSPCSCRDIGLSHPQHRWLREAPAKLHRKCAVNVQALISSRQLLPFLCMSNLT